MNIQMLNSKQRPLSQEELTRYFEKPPAFASKLILIGLASLLFLGLPCASLSHPYGFVWLLIFGSPLAVGIGMLVIFNARSRPTDEEYDAWVNSWKPSIYHYGMEKLGLDPHSIEAGELWIRGVVWPSRPDAAYYANNASPVQTKRGKDGFVRSSVNRFTFFYPMQHYIAVFIGDVNALGPVRYQASQTYFYDDIVGIETMDIVLQLDKGSYPGSQQF